MISLELKQSCFHGGGSGGRLQSTEVTEGTEPPVDKRVQETIDLGV